MTHVQDEIEIGRALAASDAVAVIMLGLSAVVLWYRRLTSPSVRRVVPLTDREVNIDQMLTSLAIVLSGLALRYAVNVGSLLGWWPGSSSGEYLVRLALVYLVIGACIVALRTATYPVFGNGATLVFIGLGALGGCGLYVWG
jgi:hypothetical protein